MRILIVDDHALVRRGLRAILEMHPGWDLCGEASGGLEAITKAQELLPDIVIMDVSMPGTSGLEATREIVRAQPDIAVLIVTMHEASQLVAAAREAGASGYLLKSDTDAHLIEALTALSRRETYFPPAVSSPADPRPAGARDSTSRS